VLRAGAPVYRRTCRGRFDNLQRAGILHDKAAAAAAAAVLLLYETDNE